MLVDGKYKNAQIRMFNVTAWRNKKFTLQSLYIQIRISNICLLFFKFNIVQYKLSCTLSMQG